LICGLAVSGKNVVFHLINLLAGNKARLSFVLLAILIVGGDL